LAIGSAFVGHPVIRDDGDHGVQLEHPPDALVDFTIE
jgi:hypothetical protein